MNGVTLRTLLIEDNPGDALLVKEMLAASAGQEFDVVHVSRLSEADEYLNGGADGFDVAFVDLSLPDSQGLQTLASVREHAPHLPVVVLTGLQDRETGLEAVRRGAQDYLVKGQVDGELLARSASYAIERQRLEVELARTLERLEEEIRIIADIQATLLPASLPKVPGYELDAYFRPAQRAAGDYFDFFPLSDGRLGLLLADVSGHGAHAAVLMAMTRVVAHILDPKQSPEIVLAELNAKLWDNIPKSQFVSAVYGVLDAEAGHFTYASAAHPAPLHYDPNDHKVHAQPRDCRLPLGLAPDTGYTARSFDLQPGSVIALCTDGVLEPRNAHGEQFGESRLGQCIVSNHLSIQSVRESILSALDDFHGLAQLEDDATFLLVRALTD